MVQQIRPSGLEKQGFRNLVYNGDMMVHQRTGSIQVTDTDTRVLDGFGVETRVLGDASYDATWSQSTTVPAGQGFKYSLKCDVASTTTPSDSEESTYIRESQVAKMSMKEYEKRAEEIMEAQRSGKFIYDMSRK